MLLLDQNQHMKCSLAFVTITSASSCFIKNNECLLYSIFSELPDMHQLTLVMESLSLESSNDDLKSERVDEDIISKLSQSDFYGLFFIAPYRPCAFCGLYVSHQYLWLRFVFIPHSLTAVKTILNFYFFITGIFWVTASTFLHLYLFGVFFILGEMCRIQTKPV